MSPQSQQTVYTVLDVLALLPLAWVSFYAVGAAVTGGATVTSGRGGGILWTLAVLWLALRFAGVIA